MYLYGIKKKKNKKKVLEFIDAAMDILPNEFPGW